MQLRQTLWGALSAQIEQLTLLPWRILILAALLHLDKLRFSLGLL